MFSVDLSIHCPYIWKGMLYPWVILFPCWPSRSESQPSYPCRHKLTVPEFLLTIPGETKTLLLLSLVLTWLPSGPLWVSQHWHSSLLSWLTRRVGLGISFQDLESPLHTHCQMWEVPAVLRFSISLSGLLLVYSNTPSSLLCSQNLVIPGIKELKPFSGIQTEPYLSLLVCCETLISLLEDGCYSFRNSVAYNVNAQCSFVRILFLKPIVFLSQEKVGFSRQKTHSFNIFYLSFFIFSSIHVSNYLV